MLLKIILFLGSFVGGYFILLLGVQSWSASLSVAAFMGFVIAGIGLNISHDACHDSISPHRWVNHVLAHSFTMVGVHAYNWRITHNIIHHTYTNVPYADGDLHTVPFLRYFNIDLPQKKYHAYQRFYAYGLYCLATIVWVFYKDYLHISRDTHVGYRKKTAPRREYLIMFFGKFLHYTMFLILPVALMHKPIAMVLACFILMHAVAGITLAAIFAVGHAVDGLEMPRFDDNRIIHDSWYAHQLSTTANFSNRNKLLTWAIGSLNFQIEHHLFPRICHVHYPAIAKIVKSTAAEFGLPYLEFQSFGLAHAAHMRHLKKYGEMAALS